MESTEEEAEEATLNAASNHDRLRKIARALELNEQLVQRLENRRARLLEELDELDADLDAVDGDGDQEIEEEEEEMKPPPPPMISTTTNTAQKKKAVSLIPFTRPYFRDSLGMSAPPCKTELYSPSPAFVDLLSMRSRGGGGGHHNQWTEAERETIVKEVRSQYRMVHNRELVEQMTRLLESNEQGQQGPTAEVTKRIEQLNDQLALARSGGDPEPERGEEAMRAIDWMVVAKQLPPERTADDAELQYLNYLHQSIPKGEWSVEEAARLKELVEEEDNSHPDWDRIACRLGTGRLAWQCCSHYQATFNRRLQKSGPIVGEEAEEMVRIIEAYQCAVTGRIDWRNVAALVEGRTLNQVQYFHRKRLCPTVVRPWLRLEDKVLLAGVKLWGDGSWSRIAQYLPLRNNRQVRQRYKSQLEFAFSSGSGTGTGTGSSSITTGHCAQRRKFGAWIAAEDELILKMSQSYTKVVKGRDGGEERRLIDIPLITRMYFPNRNVSQVYRRYHYLSRFISLAEHGKPSSPSSSTSMPAGAAAAEDEDDSCGLLMAELQKVTRNRQRDRKSAIVTGRLAASLPDGKEALGRFLLKGRQKLAKLLKREQFDVVLAEAEEDLKEEESIEEEDEEDAEDEEKEDVEDEAEDIATVRAPPFPTTTYQLVIKKEDEDEGGEEGQDWNDAQQTHLEYDQIFRTLHRLNGLRKAANGVMFTALDLNANELLKTALTEMIDPDVEENLQLSLLPAEAANADPQTDYSVASLDTMRYFLSTVAGCTLTRGEGPEKDSAAAHCTTTLALLPPNSSTAFGWALLQVMTRALMCRLAEEPEEAVEEERREEVRGSEEFAEARSIFRSLFTWPALLASPPLARDERITEELRRGRTDQPAEGQEEGGEGNTEDSPEVPAAAECSQSLAVVQPAKRPRGRPRKRTFYFDSAGIDFVRVRAHQAALFLTLHQSDLLGRLHQAAAPDGYFSLLRRQQGKHWPTEAREHLRERVKRFLDAVWSTVDGRLAVKEAQKEKGKKKRMRTREPGEAEEGQKKKTTSKQQQQQPNTTADEVQVVPMRRSTRWRIPKQGPQED